MAAASSRFHTVCDEDLEKLLVEAVPEKNKTATKYGMKIFHGVRKESKQELNEFILYLHFSKSAIF